MSKNNFILKSFGFFYRYKPIRLIFLFLITLFLGFNQGISIVLLIPLLSLIAPSGETLTVENKWVELLYKLPDYLGLEINLGSILIAFSVCLLSIAVLNYFQAIMQAEYQQGFSYQTRKRLFKKIITSDWSFLNSKSKHNHIQVLTTEIPKMTNYYYFYLGLFTKLIFIITHITLALLLSIKFTAFVVITGLIVFYLLRKYLKKSMILGQGNIKAFRKMLKHIDDFWLTVKISKVHNSEEFYYKKFDDSNAMLLDYQYKQLKNRAVPQFLFTVAGTISLVVVVYFAYNLAKLPLSSLFVLILLFARIFPKFGGINNDINILSSNVESVKMVLKMDNEIKDHDFKKNIITEEINFNHLLEIKNLTFAYDQKQPLFMNFSESIPAMQITGIIGKSGCGKTTLIDILAGLQKLNKGLIIVDGIQLTPEKLPAWKRNLGYLPQDSFFIDGTLRENLIWDSNENPSDEQLFSILSQVNADHLVKEQSKGLDSYIANYQYHFSGGERQRLALARVLIRKPKLLLLDEATSALDSETEEQIMNCLMKLKNELAIVFVTHRQYLTSYFDKVIDLNSMQTKEYQT